MSFFKSYIILSISFLTVQTSCAMEGMSVSVSFLPLAEHVGLDEVSKHVQARVQFDPSKGNLEYTEDICLIKRDSECILKEAIDLMGNVTINPHRFIYVDSDVQSDEAQRRLLARKCIALAIKYGACIDTVSHNVTALKRAVQYDDKDLVSFLMERGANPNDGIIPIYFGALSFPVAHALAPKVDYAKRGPLNETVLHHVMKSEYAAKLAQLYCNKRPDFVDVADKEGLTPLKQLMIEVLKEGYNVESASNKMKSILMSLGSESRYEHAVDALIFAQLRSRSNLPGKEHRNELKSLVQKIAQRLL